MLEPEARQSNGLKKVGILALQGCVEPHVAHFQALGLEVVRVKKPAQLAGLLGLVIPGGESTTMLKLIDIFEFQKPLSEFAAKLPVWGICAGSILMAKTVTHPPQLSFGWMDIDVERNAYGSQLESFETQMQNETIAFIRAPRITRVGTSATILESYGGAPVFVRQGKHLVTTFHSELSLQTPSFVHRAFAELL